MRITAAQPSSTQSAGTNRLLFGMILGVLAFWLFAQTTLNIAPIMAASLGIKTSLMNIAVSTVLTVPKGGMHRGS